MIIVQLIKGSPHNLQVVEVCEEDRAIFYNHYLLQVRPTSYDSGAVAAAMATDGVEETPQVYLDPGHMVQLDTYTCTHGPGARLHGEKITAS